MQQIGYPCPWWSELAPSSGTELTVTVDRDAEGELMDGSAAGHSNLLDWHAPPALDLAQPAPIARLSVGLIGLLCGRSAGTSTSTDAMTDRAVEGAELDG